MPIWTLARKDLSVLLRDKRAAVILFSMPIVFILVLGLALGESFGQKPDDRVRISIVDADRGLPPDPGPYPGRKWSEVVRDDLAQTGGIAVEIIQDRETAERLIRRGKKAAIIVFTESFSDKVHRCSFLEDKFHAGVVGLNPFFRDGIDLNLLGIEVLDDPKQMLASSIIKQAVGASMLRVVMPWMIGKAFDKISDKQFIDEMAKRVEVTSFGKSKFKPLGLLNASQRVEVGTGVQESLQEMFKKYDLRAKDWAKLTRSEPGSVEGGKLTTYQSEGGGLINRGAVRYQILVPSYTVMFAFFLVLTVGWLFVSERRQGTLIRLRAAPLTRTHILLGKMIPCYFVSLGQGLFLLLAGRVIFGMKWGNHPALLVLVVSCTSIAAVGLSVLVASVARSESQVSIYGTLLVLVMAGLGGCLMPGDQMPDQIKTLSYVVTPHAWALDAYRELLVPDPNIGDVFKACGFLTGFGLGFTVLAWWLLKLD